MQPNFYPGCRQSLEGSYSIGKDSSPTSKGNCLKTFRDITRFSLVVQGLLLIGAVFKSTVPDETDEERRQLER